MGQCFFRALLFLLFHFTCKKQSNVSNFPTPPWQHGLLKRTTAANTATNGIGAPCQKDNDERAPVFLIPTPLLLLHLTTCSMPPSCQPAKAFGSHTRHFTMLQQIVQKPLSAAYRYLPMLIGLGVAQFKYQITNNCLALSLGNP